MTTTIHLVEADRIRYDENALLADSAMRLGPFDSRHDAVGIAAIAERIYPYSYDVETYTYEYEYEPMEVPAE
ncbi:hypothetical protein EGH24_13930 [Halonotius terrestris]|uniref:Uncharacterized protein n=1 Tax=Halonotius terrestris TaxID=2487750 RepID=A0A8J8P7Q9_9EURY|nr:hypothetical protein [Halonotius terrestris]TQQ78617.1 hypothetical protein EGH24_13930 [Halonotius terrestris]